MLSVLDGLLVNASAGMQTLFVLSGEMTRADLQSARGPLVPDYVAESVALLGFES